MKIAYVAEIDTSRLKGVQNKIINTSNAYSRINGSIRFFIITQEKIPNRDKIVYLSYKRPKLKVISYIKKQLLSLKLKSELKAYAPDIIYLRDTIASPLISFGISGYPYIVEINSNPWEDYKLLDTLKYLYFSLTERFMYAKASGFFFVTNELAKVPNYTRYNKPCLVSSNGVDCTEVSLLPPPKTKEIQFVFIGTPDQPWHGLDKILYLARLLPQHIFHIIGYSLNNELPNVRSYGYLSNDTEILKIISLCDIGIGTLSLYMKKMTEACPLKVRQYLSHGLPVILGYKDTDILPDAEFILELPCTPENVSANVKRIEGFALMAKGNEHLRNKAREFALTTLSVDAKEKKKMEFSKRILDTIGKESE